jgi:hypothetical protein
MFAILQVPKAWSLIVLCEVGMVEKEIDSVPWVLSFKGSTDQFTIQRWGGGEEYRIERFEFAGAEDTVWDAANDAVFEIRRVG